MTENAVTESASEPEAATPERARRAHHGTPAAAEARDQDQVAGHRSHIAVLAAVGIRSSTTSSTASNYVTTDNAQIDGNQISINAPGNGHPDRLARAAGHLDLHKNALGREDSRSRAAMSSRRW